VTVTKGITLNGNGCVITFTTVSSIQVGVLALYPDTVASLTVTGFTFQTCFPDGQYPIGVHLASGPPYDQAFRIYNNTFSDNGAGGTCIEFSGLGPGLVDHNAFTTSVSASEVIHLIGGSASCTSCWTEDVVPGSANMIIFENDVWTESSGYCQVEEGNYGAVFVIRYSTFNSCQGDVHGGPPSNRWVELYHNTYNNCCSSGSDYDFRGGSGMIWGNSRTGTAQGNTSVGPICGSSDTCGSYPVQYQFGMGLKGTNYTPVYIWGNDSSIQSTSNNDSTLVQVGSAYNVCSGLSGDLCNAIVTTSAPSSWLRCESAADISAGCPVTYSYTPYTYPHPMDDCPASTFGTVSGGCAAPPSPPTNVAAVAH
jgi:hypothetical protein